LPSCHDRDQTKHSFSLTNHDSHLRAESLATPTYKKKKPPISRSASQRLNFPIVGIGASAGGLNPKTAIEVKAMGKLRN